MVNDLGQLFVLTGSVLDRVGSTQSGSWSSPAQPSPKEKKLGSRPRKTLILFFSFLLCSRRPWQPKRKPKFFFFFLPLLQKCSQHHIFDPKSKPINNINTKFQAIYIIHIYLSQKKIESGNLKQKQNQRIHNHNHN